MSASSRIVDASPLILLDKVGRLDLLEGGGSEVIVPAAVVGELTAHPDDTVLPTIRGRQGWRVGVTVEVPDSVRAWDLGGGESEVLALGLASPGVEVILDDLAARRCAAVHGLLARGTVGLVLLARQTGRIPSARVGRRPPAGGPLPHRRVRRRGAGAGRGVRRMRRPTRNGVEGWRGPVSRLRAPGGGAVAVGRVAPRRT